MSSPDKFEIFYIRHADTRNGTNDDRCKCDIDISSLGEKQIALLSERFKGKEFDAVLCSPLVRCVKTAAAICDNLSNDPDIEIMPELIENGTLPGYTGPDMNYLRKYHNNIILCKDRIIRNLRNKTDRQNDARAKKIIKYLRRRFNYGQKILVVCHGSFGNHFIPAAAEMKKGRYILSVSNTSVSKIKYTSDGKIRISFLNDISHLRPLMQNYEFDT